jgi:hypothetical protein
VKRNYYYLVAGLQDITLDVHKLSMGQLEFRNELREQLHPDDYRLLEKLFLPVDNLNLLRLLGKRDETFEDKGNFSQAQLEENIKEPNGELPSYMDRFIEAVKTEEPIIHGMSYENQLTSVFYNYVQYTSNEFLRDWFFFDRNLNNVYTALICRKYDIPYENQIIGSDEIAEAIRKSHARDFGIATEFSYLEDVFNIIKNENLQEREKALDTIRWKYLDDATFFEYFTIDRLLAFTIKLAMVERWLVIDKEYGTRMFEELLGELKSSYKLPETFTEK